MQAVHAISNAGAHSRDGRFTSRVLGEPIGAIKVLKAPKTVSSPIAGLSATIKASEKKDVAILTISSSVSASAALPDEMGEASKQRWLEDHKTLIEAHTDLTVEEDGGTADETIEMPAFGGQVSDQDVSSAIRNSAQNTWNKHLNGALGDAIRRDGFHGYRPGDDPQLLPENSPYTVEGDPAELTGHQRATILALHREYEGGFFSAQSNFYGRTQVDWFDKGNRMNTAYIAPDGKIDRAEIAPVGWETKPWLRPVLNNEPKFIAMLERYKHTRAELD